MSKRVGYFIIAATILALCAGAATVQSLPSARLGLTGSLGSRLESPVMLTVRLPRGYGLSATERRTGWPELNELEVKEVALDGAGFLVELSPARYCVHRFLWQRTPPPPAWFVLRFSDVADEEYIVWSHRGRSDYVVRDLDGVERPKSQAGWRLHLGSFDPQGEEGRDRLWLLGMELVRQKGADAEDGAGPGDARPA